MTFKFFEVAARCNACVVFAGGFITLPGLAQAAQTTLLTESGFVAAASAVSIKSFEATTARLRGMAALITPLLTLTGGTTPIGVQSAINSPEEAFGAVATDGVRFASVYLPNQPQGTLVFDLAAPPRRLDSTSQTLVKPQVPSACAPTPGRLSAASTWQLFGQVSGLAMCSSMD